MRTEYQNLMYVWHHQVQVVYVAQYSAPMSARTPLPPAPPTVPPYCERQPPLSGSLEGYGVDRMAMVRSSCGIGSVYSGGRRAPVYRGIDGCSTIIVAVFPRWRLQYSRCSPVLGVRTPGTYVRSTHGYLHGTYVTTTNVGGNTVHSTAWYRAKKKLYTTQCVHVRTSVPAYQCFYVESLVPATNDATTGRSVISTHRQAS
jgi:hypothetical protein